MNTAEKNNEKSIIGIDEYLGERLINHIDETFEYVIGKELRLESLHPKPKIEADVTSTENPKSLASDGGNRSHRIKGSRTKPRMVRKRRIEKISSALATTRIATIS